MPGPSHVSQTDPGGGDDLASKQVFTTGEAAHICNVSQQTIIRCFDRGRLTGFRVPGSKFRRIPRAELIRFMQDNGIPLERLDSGRRRVVVIAGNPQAGASFAASLAAVGPFECDAAESDLHAGLLIGERRPHAVVLLPGAGEPEIIRRLRAWPATRGVCVVCIHPPGTGMPVPDADATLTEPAPPAAVAARLADILGVNTRAVSGRS